jgi:hypothetical protein
MTRLVETSPKGRKVDISSRTKSVSIIGLRATGERTSVPSKWEET